MVSNVVNNVEALSKHCDFFRKKQSDFIVEALENDDILSGRGHNQETTLQLSGDTLWGSHYNTLVSLISMFGLLLIYLE